MQSLCQATLTVAIVFTSSASLFAGAAEPLQVYRGPVDALDVMGGVVSGQVIVRVAAGVEPRLSSAGWTFAPRGVALDDRGMEVAMRLRGASERSAVQPFLSRVPSKPDVAARHGLDRAFVVTLEAGVDPRAVMVDLAEFTGPGRAIERVEAIGIGGILTIPNDASFGLQYGLRNTGQTVQGQAGVAGAGLETPDAWSLETGSADVVIAVIDTGVSASHPDLVPKLVAGWNTTANSSNSDDSFLISHGSHCAGIAAAASNNGLGIAGVSWGARIMPVKVLNFLGGGTELDIADGIMWAADHGADIGSMSIGYPGATSVLEDAVNYAADLGMVLVAATGNTAGAAISAPAKYPAVIAVGATDNTDTIASFTSTGPEMSVTAPGVDVYSCWDILFSSNTYTYQSGTSMACPHVAGLAALILSANPTLDAQGVRQILEATAVDLGARGFDPIYGWGRVDAFGAVAAAIASNCAVADLNCDGAIDGADLGLLLAAWGLTGPGDLDGNGVVDGADLGLLLAAWAP